jgi:hypothetical protein
MHRCPASLCERLRIISQVYHTQKGSGEVSFNPHGTVLYSPAERAVRILKRITTAHSSTLYISLCQSRPSPGFITPGPDCLPPVEFMAGLHPAVRSNTLRRADVAQPLKTFQRNSQLNFFVMFFSPSGGSMSLRFQISTHDFH